MHMQAVRKRPLPIGSTVGGNGEAVTGDDQEPPAGRYRFGQVVIDVGAHSLTVCGTPRNLEPKAFAVLLELVRHPGQVLDKDRLLDAVWGHRCVTPCVLARTIAQIRRALLDMARAPRLIETVPTLGYRFIAPVQADGDPPPFAARAPGLMEEIRHLLAAPQGLDAAYPNLHRHLHLLLETFGDQRAGAEMYELALRYGMELLARHDDGANGSRRRRGVPANPHTKRTKTS
ncbi:MAG: hypothetical protein E6Q87_06215 [Cellvibrionales bacterium]|nr:MAG: hypothetical protein E6Q87_06215 [Cellvibrionales bacterium]